MDIAVTSPGQPGLLGQVLGHIFLRRDSLYEIRAKIPMGRGDDVVGLECDGTSHRNGLFPCAEVDATHDLALSVECDNPLLQAAGELEEIIDIEQLVWCGLLNLHDATSPLCCEKQLRSNWLQYNPSKASL